MKDKPPFIYCDTSSNNALKIFNLLKRPIVRQKFLADILWLRRRFKHVVPGEKQCLNHLPGERSIFNKGILTETLHTAAETEWAGFYPKSYCLYKKEHKERFFSKTRDGIWLLKPAGGSRGIGIEIYDDTKKIKDKLENDSLDGKYIVQKYIENPLLVNNHKVSIRNYWLVMTSNSMPLKAYMYPEGTAKVCTEPYDLKDLDNMSSHLTNTFQNKDRASYDPTKYKLNWNLLAKKLGDSSIEQKIIDRVQSALSKLVNISHNEINKSPGKGGYFAMFGADWVLDENLNPWLSEVQRGPGLKFADPLKKVLLPNVIDETIDIVYETHKAKDKDSEPDCVKKYIRFK